MLVTNCESFHSHVNGDPIDPSLMTKQQLLPGLDSQYDLDMLMMGVNIHSQQQLRKKYGVSEGISVDILSQHKKYYELYIK